jgi:hypothetical protein
MTRNNELQAGGGPARPGGVIAAKIAQDAILDVIAAQ